MALKLIATDMDGTLLTDADKSFDRELFDSLLKQMDEQGVTFVVASGNQYAKLRQYMNGFHGRGIFYIAENGAYIADDSGDILVSGFKKATVEKIIEVLEDFPQIGYIISAHSGAYLPRDRAGAITKLIREHLEFMGAEMPHEVDYYTFMNRFYPGTKVIESLDEVGEDVVVKFALQTRRRDLELVLKQLVEKLPPEVVPVASGFGAIDLISRGVNKGSALKWLGERQGIDPSEMIAFGDNSNDLEMLKLVGEGIAMENATDLVKSAADTVIGTNEDGAVLTYIQQKLSHAVS